MGKIFPVGAELAALERLQIPEVIKASKRQRICWRVEPYRPKRKRMALDAVYTADGEPIFGDSHFVETIVQEWGPVFKERQLDAEAMARFTDVMIAMMGVARRLPGMPAIPRPSHCIAVPIRPRIIALCVADAIGWWMATPYARTHVRASAWVGSQSREPRRKRVEKPLARQTRRSAQAPLPTTKTTAPTLFRSIPPCGPRSRR